MKKSNFIKFICIALSVVLFCGVMAGCNVNVNMGDVNVSGEANVNIGGDSDTTSSVTDNSSETSSAAQVGGGVFLAPEISELPATWTVARPTIKWSGLKSGVTAHVIITSADGKVHTDKSGITGSSYTLEKDLVSGTTYTLKVLYNRNGTESSMAGISNNGKAIKCTIKKVTTMESIVARMKSSTDYQIMMVGDSITYGTGSGDNYLSSSAPNDEKTYVAYFARMLGEKLTDKTIVRYDGVYDSSKKNANGFTYIHTYNGPVTVKSGTKGKITVVRSGIGGNTVARLIGRSDDFLGKRIDNKMADLFIIKSGINDALNHTDTDGQKYVNPDTYKKNLDTLLTKIYKANPDADVILMTPTVNDDHTKKTSSQLDAYAEKMKQVANDWKIPIVDTHKLWMDHLDKNAANYGSGDWLTNKSGDLCHPSPKGHEAIATEIIRSIFG